MQVETATYRWPQEELQALASDLQEVTCTVEHYRWSSSYVCDETSMKAFAKKIVAMTPGERDSAFPELVEELFHRFHYEKCWTIRGLYDERIRNFCTNHQKLSDRVQMLIRDTWDIEQYYIRSDEVRRYMQEQRSNATSALRDISGYLRIEQDYKREIHYQMEESNHVGELVVCCSFAERKTKPDVTVVRTHDTKALRYLFLLKILFSRGPETKVEETEAQLRMHGNNSRAVGLTNGPLAQIFFEIFTYGIKRAREKKWGIYRSKLEKLTLQKVTDHVYMSFDRWSSGGGGQLQRLASPLSSRLKKDSTTWGYVVVVQTPGQDPKKEGFVLPFDFGSDQEPVPPDLVWGLKEWLLEAHERRENPISLETIVTIFRTLRLTVPNCSDQKRGYISDWMSIFFESMIAVCLEKRLKTAAAIQIMKGRLDQSQVPNLRIKLIDFLTPTDPLPSAAASQP